MRDGDTLSRIEAEITQEAATRWEQSPGSSSFDFEHYKAIHKHLFQDLYSWAGETRDINISKKGTRFCLVEDIPDYSVRLFLRLRELDFLRELKRHEFIVEFVDFYVSTNYLHPFREGNGRTQRLFLQQLASSTGYELNFSAIDVDELMISTIQSANGVTNGLARIFKKSMKVSEVLSQDGNRHDTTKTD
ncbi:MAG: Fic family protein [Oscillospiraceae bacterium]|nr:Fic family protein [Oscillospiraceae bacterium]